MVTTIKAVPRDHMVKNKVTVLSMPNVAAISIIDFNQTPLFDREDYRIITLRFDDIEDVFNERPELILFSDAHAKKIIDFLAGIKNLIKIDTLLINCGAGISRSGAVARFARKYFGLDKAQFHKDNPYIFPNKLILRKLFTAQPKDYAPSQKAIGGPKQYEGLIK